MQPTSPNLHLLSDSNDHHSNFPSLYHVSFPINHQDLIDFNHSDISISLIPQHLRNLHFTACSFERYLELLEEPYNPYDIVDGLLVLREMPDSDHERISDYLYERFQYYIAHHRKDLCIHRESSIFISKTWNETTLTYDSTVRKGDLVIGYKSRCEAVHETLSPRSQVIQFDETKTAPFMVIEITSTYKTRNDDLHSKRDQYRRRGVEEYVIIDRDKDRRRNESKHNPSVIIHKFKSGGSSSSSSQDTTNFITRTFKEDEDINLESTLISKLELTPKLIFTCPSGSEWRAKKVKMEEEKMEKTVKMMKTIEADRDKERAGRNKAEAGKAVERTKRLRERQMRKANEVLLRKAGITPVSGSTSSESSTDSPIQKKRK